MDPVVLVVVVVLAIEIPWAMRAARRLSKKYSVRLIESLFFRRLVQRNNRVAYVGGGVIGAVVIYSLVRYATQTSLNLPQIPSPWGSVAVGLALIVMFWGPIDDDRLTTRIAKGNRLRRDDDHLPPYAEGTRDE